MAPLDVPPRGRRTCLVAVDGTPAGVAALAWGLRHAAEHGMDVEVLTVWPSHGSVLVHEVPGHFCAPRWSARTAQLATVREATHGLADAPRLTTTLENADPADAIVRASARHHLVVLGAGPRRGPHRLTDRILLDSQCDVVVVSPDRDAPDPRATHQQGAPS